MWVVRTDAPCSRCGQRHEYATKMCTLVVYVDGESARMVAKQLGGSAQEILQIPEDPSNPGHPIPHVLYLHRKGLPDPAYPQTRGSIG